MAIYKLEEICESITENVKPILPQLVINTSDVLNGFISPKLEEHKVLGQFKKTAKIGDILFSEIRPGNGRWALIKEDISKCLISTKMLVIRSNKKIVLPNFLYILLTQTINDKIVSLSNSRSGTFPQITFSVISKMNVDIPSIEEQQKIIDIIEQKEDLFIKHSNTVRIDSVENCKNDIEKLIDIIEPIEKTISSLKKALEKIKIYELYIINNYFPTNRKLNFEKGLLPMKSNKGKTPFLNVSAANGKINRYVENEPNTFIGDVTLSLDANCGLVNNSLEGYNGYLYKVSENNAEPWEVYYSLLTKESQNIIKKNETGTTIKHSPKSKSELMLFDFGEAIFLKSFFDLNIKINLLLLKCEILNNKMISLLIK